MIAPTSPTLETPLVVYFNGTYARLKLAGKSENTRRLYKNTLGQFAICLGRLPTLADLNDDTVAQFVSWTVDVPAILSGKPRSPRTANKHRDQLLAIWRFAARKRHVDTYPDVEPLPEPKRLSRCWTPEEVRAILVSAQGFGGLSLGTRAYGTLPPGQWWYTLVSLLYYTGLRIGAALQLRCDDFNRERQQLFVRAELQKQKADQCIPLSDDLVASLEEFIALSRRDLIFGFSPCAMGPYSVYAHFEAILKQAGLPHGRFDKFHKLRRTSATFAEIYVGPGTATHHLGHADPRVTERYIDKTMLPQVNVAASLPTMGTRQKAVDGSRSIAKLLDEFCRSIEGTRFALARHRTKLTAIFKKCHIKTPDDFAPEKAEEMFTVLKAQEFSSATIGHYWQSLSCFGRWLVREKKVGPNVPNFLAKLFEGFGSARPARK